MSGRQSGASNTSYGVEPMTLLVLSLFCLTYISKALTDGFYYAHGIGTSLMWMKYVTAFLAIYFGLIHVTRKQNLVFVRETESLLLLVFAFTVVTIIIECFNGGIQRQSIDELLRLAMPPILAFSVLNACSRNQIVSAMKVILVFTVIGYIAEIGVSSLSIQSILASDYSSSYSPLESSIFAGTATSLCFFFCYYRKNIFWTILSFLFAVAVFKRLVLVFACIALVAPMFYDRNRRVSPQVLNGLKALFVIMAIIYLFLLLPQSNALFSRVFHADSTSLTMNRNNMMNRAINANCIFQGFGTTTIAAGHNIEMDLIKITLELTPIALIAFINIYWNITRNNAYCVMFMFYLLLNLLLSDSLTANFGWAISFITIGSITYYESQENSILDSAIIRRMSGGNNNV